MSKRRRPGKRITKAEADLAIGRATKELENEYGLRTGTIADFTTKFKIKPGAPVNSRDSKKYDLDNLVEILDAHYNMDQFDRDNRDIHTNKEILKNYFLEGNQSKMIKGEGGKNVIKYQKETTKFKVDGETKEYTPFTLLEKIEHSTSTSDRIITAFETMDSRGPNGENGVAKNGNLSVKVKAAWEDYKNDKITINEFVDTVRMEDEKENDAFKTIKAGSTDAVRVSQQEGSGRR